MVVINVTKLHQELAAAGLPVIGVSEDGRIDFLPEATHEQKAQAAAILDAHNPVDFDALRWAEYPDIRRIVRALLVGKQELEAVRAAIQAVDEKYPMT